MKPTLFLFLLISSSACVDLKYISKRNSVDGCIDWSVDLKTYHVLAGEPLRVKCALFYSYIRTNYSMTQNAKLRLIWYKNKGDSEEPLTFSDHRLTKEGDSIWLHTVEMEDSGFYTCVLRNTTYCMKVSMSLTVEESDEDLCYSSQMRYLEKSEIAKSKMITCPDIDDYLAPYKQPTVSWYKECQKTVWRSSIIINTTSLWIPEVEEDDGGNYTCELQYGSRVVRRTTELKVTAPVTARPPKVRFPAEQQASFIDVQLGMPLSLDCKAFFGYSGESRPIIYWMKGEKFIEELAGHVKESEVKVLREYLGEKEVELSLTFDGVEETDMGKYTCYVENLNGRGYGSVIIQKKDMYRLELAGGLGAILLLLGVLTAIYKCYNMEMMLCYRRYFGNVTEDDSKEYDAYISYTKVDLDSISQEISEEEQFALEILPDVLENHYGYKLFIPDRDLIPTSMYVEDLTRGVEQSRRLILILTPEFVARRGWSIFQLETRLHSMLVTGDVKVIMIECNDLQNIINYQELVAFKHMIKVLSVIKWQGPKSNPLKSKFWKQVIYDMPLKKKETLSRRQVMDSGEQSLFGDMQAVSSIAVSATSPSVVRRYGEIPDFNQQHYCYGYEYEIPASSMQPATLGNQHMYNNIPMKLLSGQVTQNNTGRKPKQEIPLNSTFVPLLSRELTSDIW